MKLPVNHVKDCSYKASTTSSFYRMPNSPGCIVSPTSPSTSFRPIGMKRIKTSSCFTTALGESWRLDEASWSQRPMEDCRGITLHIRLVNLSLGGEYINPPQKGLLLRFSLFSLSPVDTGDYNRRIRRR